MIHGECSCCCCCGCGGCGDVVDDDDDHDSDGDGNNGTGDVVMMFIAAVVFRLPLPHTAYTPTHFQFYTQVHTMSEFTTINVHRTASFTLLPALYR